MEPIYSCDGFAVYYKEDLVFYEFLIHKCLYYKHSCNLISDYEFDMFEKMLEQQDNTWYTEMVDWDCDLCRSAVRVNGYSKQRLLKIGQDLINLRKGNAQ